MQTSVKKVGKKKLAKLQAKAEAKAQREQEQAEREERKRKAEEVQKQEDERRMLEEEEERKRAEKRRAEKEERERRELEEYMKMKANFEVKEQGYDCDVSEENAEDLLEQFTNFIRKKKVVHIDELASKFRTRPEDIVARLESLLREKRLTGLFDDRGLFTFVKNEELHNVAKFINQRGRVNLVELIEHSNQLISLMPSDEN